MSEIVTAAVVCLSVLAGAFAGARIRRMLPAEHMSEQSRNIVNVAIGLIATLSAVLMILEMDQPFEGFLQVPATPLAWAVQEMRR